MGNREDLLTGARQAILDRGLAKVTARDIANAAGVSLAAIGYHFGSKDRLVMEALTLGVGTEIGDEMDAAIKDAGEGRSLMDALAPTWDGLIEVVLRNRENLLLSLENGVQLARSPESQGFMEQASAGAYADISEVLRATHPQLSEVQATALAKTLFMLFQGLAMQSLIAPATVEQFTGADLATAVAAVCGN
ncbi:TetR/AcrR family transcriptional regulator [Nocardia sp. NBC_01388]|uniref:TetR/AcrR family transcriptional regulator n=1 Tax=Nocardia sp. NBC_01388 TaxID=2903596 RepID=UPI00324BCC6F